MLTSSAMSIQDGGYALTGRIWLEVVTHMRKTIGDWWMLYNVKTIYLLLIADLETSYAYLTSFRLRGPSLKTLDRNIRISKHSCKKHRCFRYHSVSPIYKALLTCYLVCWTHNSQFLHFVLKSFYQLSHQISWLKIQAYFIPLKVFLALLRLP